MSLQTSFNKAIAAKQAAEDARISLDCRLQELKHQTRLLQLDLLAHEVLSDPQMPARVAGKIVNQGKRDYLEKQL